MAKAKLTREQQTYVVQALACFDSPSVVAASLRKDFNVVLTPQSIEAYDPNKKAEGTCRTMEGSLCRDTQDLRGDTASIGISHRAVRLRALQRMADKAENSGNMVLASSLLKQAAEEVGNAYTNRRELTGKDGKDLPVPVSPVTIFQLPDNGRS
ncbi:DUF2280 domain-containing protein [Rhizobium giardinii]|uniref:DUF2280 domain-containing protein n=1 Tax=Rhizobium giardinii TaxID=56731 RepID=UPI003D6F413C